MTMDVSPDRLRELFSPRSVAIVGASNRSAFSQGAFRNLSSFGLGDKTYLVNRRGDVVHGKESFTSCRTIGEEVDVALVMVPQQGCIPALEDVAAAGIRNIVLLTAGYGETGAEGRMAEQELLDACERLKILMLGPNMLGFVNFADSVPVCAIASEPIADGTVALVSQSGGSCAAMAAFAKGAGIDLSYIVTLGNESMVDAGHVLDYLVDDPSTRSIAMFLESIRDPRGFARAAGRAAEAEKAVVVLKVGRSELAGRTAEAHTGALVGDSRVTSAVLRELNVIQVESIEDMLVTARVAADIGRLERPGIGVVSFSGGACDIVADRANDEGLWIPEFSDETAKGISAVMPSYGTTQNPLDVTGAAHADPGLFTTALEAVGNDVNVGAVLVVHNVPSSDSPAARLQEPRLAAIAAGTTASAVPVVNVSYVQQPLTEYAREAIARHGLSMTISGIDQAMRSFGHLVRWSSASVRNTDEPASIEVRAGIERGVPWSEAEARNLLARGGVDVVPAVLAQDEDVAVSAASTMGGSVALKVVSAQILHKSDIGAVALDVRGPEEVRAAYRSIMRAAGGIDGAEVAGILVSPMRRDGVELLVGVVRDAQWGPLLAVGFGGIWVEAFDDTALARLPVPRERVAELLSGLRGAPLLRGARGSVPADWGRLTEQILRITEVALGLGSDLEALEVNPLLVHGERVEALDCMVEWRT